MCAPCTGLYMALLIEQLKKWQDKWHAAKFPRLGPEPGARTKPLYMGRPLYQLSGIPLFIYQVSTVYHIKHVLLLHNSMLPMIRCLPCLPPTSPLYLPSSLSGPWPEAFIRAMMLFSGVSNILSLYGERERERSDYHWQSEWSLNLTRSQGRGDGNLEDTTHSVATAVELWSEWVLFIWMKT